MTNKNTLGLPKAVIGKTYAEAAKYIENLFDGRNDIASKNTKESLFGRLRETQDAEKAALEQSQGQPNNNQFALGGDPDDIVNPIQSLGVDAISNGFDNDISLSPEITGFSGARDLLETPNYQGADSKSAIHDFWGKNKTNIAGIAGLGLQTLAPMIANKRAMNQLEQAETVNPMMLSEGSIQGNFVNRQQLERNLANQAATSRHALTQSAGDAGALREGFGDIHRRSSDALANVLFQSDRADAAEKTRVQEGRLGIQQANIQQQTYANEANAQNQAQYNDQMAAYKQANAQSLTNVGKTLFNYMQATDYSKYAGMTAKLAATMDNNKNS